jgi:hypothetical protein
MLDRMNRWVVVLGACVCACGSDAKSTRHDGPDGGAEDAGSGGRNAGGSSHTGGARSGSGGMPGSGGAGNASGGASNGSGGRASGGTPDSGGASSGGATDAGSDGSADGGGFTQGGRPGSGGGPVGCQGVSTQAEAVVNEVVVDGGTVVEIVPCQYGIPDPEGSIPFDPSRLNVVVQAGIAEPIRLGNVSSSADCPNVENGWLYDSPVGPERVILCPSTCDLVKSLLYPRIDMVFGCETIFAGLR